jgi:hypothetical protein
MTATMARERPARSIGRCRAFARSREGATLVEFGFVAPVFILLICIFIDLCMVMFINAAMEGGLREASRYAITGYVEPGTTREDKIKEIVVRHSYGLINQSDLVLTYMVYGSFSDIGKPEPFVDQNGNGQFDTGEPFTDVNGNGSWDTDQGVSGPGGPGAIVAYTVQYKWIPFTPLAANLVGGDGSLTLSASIAVRNEPF